MLSLNTCLTPFLLLPPSPLSSILLTASTPKHHALCIGIANYAAESTVGSLTNPIHDAEDMSALLQSSGFQVTCLYDPTNDELHDGVQAFVEATQPGDTVLVFASCHGEQDEHSQNYLLGSDFGIPKRCDPERHALSVQRKLVVPLQKREPALSVILLDACRKQRVARDKSSGAGATTSWRHLWAHS